MDNISKIISDHTNFYESLSGEVKQLYLFDVDKIISELDTNLEELRLKYVNSAYIDSDQSRQINNYIDMKKIVDKFMPLIIAYDLYINNTK